MNSRLYKILKPINGNNPVLVFPIVKQLMLLLLMISVVTVSAQTKKQIALADKYFTAGEYYTAASLYEQLLNPPKKKIKGADFPLNAERYRTAATALTSKRANILMKQAHSYRLANFYGEAASRYKLCFEKDSSRYADALYWYAVCQRSLGDYGRAFEYISRYLSSTAEDKKQEADAKKEWDMLEFINQQMHRPDTLLYHVKKYNTSFGKEKGVFAPGLVNNNHFVFTSTATDVNAKAGVSPYHNRLFNVSRDSNNLTIIDTILFSGADANAHHGAGSISADSNFIYFTQWTKVNGKAVAAIYYAPKNENGWGAASLLPSANLYGYNSKQPFCTTDGERLYFVSDRPGGEGGYDIWYAPLAADGRAGTPINARAVNTTGDEQAPFYHTATNNLIFSSDGRTGMGGFDFYKSQAKDSAWTAPVNMGYPVNSSRDDIYFFAPEGKELMKNAMFSSDRGSDCCLETYSLNKPKNDKVIAGTVKDARSSVPIPDATIIMSDSVGHEQTTSTNPDGKFAFEVPGNFTDGKITVKKNKYKDKTVNVKVELDSDTTHIVDVVYDQPIFMDRKLVITPENVVTVYFDFDKSDLRQRSVEVLDSVYNVLLENPNGTLQVSGYTDGRGTVEYNEELSDRRARACADYLIAKGISADRITFESFGECCPVEVEVINGRDNPEGRSKNRRAWIHINKSGN